MLTSPSSFLPTLRPVPPLATIAHALDHLERKIHPQDVIINLVLEEEAFEGDDDDWVEDEFESQFVLRWLGRVIAASTKQEGVNDWERITSRASALLATVTGHCSAGPSWRTWVLPTCLVPICSGTVRTGHDFPPTPPPTRPPSVSPYPTPSLPNIPISLHIRDTTLLASGTGFRTWGSAPLLARRIGTSPATFFPPSPSTSTEYNLRVLELGSGTGLVGLAAAATLSRLDRRATVNLTDWEPSVLDNLAHNLAANPEIAEAPNVRTSVSELDWSAVPPQLRYDVILGADLIYEPSHPELIHSAVSRLLTFPVPTRPDPAFHLVVPLRSTHVTEQSALNQLLSRGSGTIDDDGEKWRLIVKSRVEGTGPDGFGKRSERRMASYWIYTIGWLKL